MHIEKCLDQLNELLVVAGRVQPGQVVRRIGLALKELEQLQCKQSEAQCIDLGTHNSVKYRLRAGRVEGEFHFGWATSDTFHLGGAPQKKLHAHVARKLGEHFGLTLLLPDIDTMNRELHDTREKLGDLQQVLRDISSLAAVEPND